ncbi:hypothetical protein D9757_002718 [Collybiopsis confluens]|uniref:HSF-type DNA-binding domain-containing protein n=1 Tax=Collybiopsis confluens TaxID=2823264 RepID=A0A8H5HW72_9AGAR|nr:hypothetical protein D9757_002718 [Collybiopsis confluens]
MHRCSSSPVLALETTSSLRSRLFTDMWKSWTDTLAMSKAYAILDELIIAGELQESSKKSVLRVVTQSDSVEEQENSDDMMARLGSRTASALNSPHYISAAGKQEIISIHTNFSVSAPSDPTDFETPLLESAIQILDQARLEKECLGDWFKHNKFASFVRQLNMYGFHKIPHLQQGALRSNSDTEFSQFQHPDFLRGKEDRLIFIERKKQITNNLKDHGVVDFPASIPPQQAAQLQSDTSAGQALDIHAIVNGIAAIRRHQANISSELNELKCSNQLLWQESLEARSRHQKQQDTINRIVKFLAGIFGHHSASPSGKEKERGSSTPVVRGSRLMIEDKKRENAIPKVGIVEVPDEEDTSPMSVSREQSPRPFASIETPGSSISYPPSSYPSPGATEISSISGGTDSITPRSEPASSPSFFDLSALSGSSNGNNGVVSTQPLYPGSELPQQDDTLRTLSPSRSPVMDERLQAALSFLTPGDIQQLFSSLNNQAFGETDTNSFQQGAQNQLPLPPSPDPSSQTVAPFNFGSLSSPLPHLSPQLASGLTDTEALISLNGPYMEQWKQASDIEQQVDQMNSGIDSLINSLGLDPSVVANAERSQNNGDVDTSVLDAPPLPSSMSDPVTQEELFSTFLNTFPSPGILPYNSGEVNGSQNNTFLGNEGATGSTTFDPISAQFDKHSSLLTSPLVSVSTPAPSGKNTRAQKRKSDPATEGVIKLQLPAKAKRRKEK